MKYPKICLCFLMLSFVPGIFGQKHVTIGNGTQSTSQFPFNGSVQQNWSDAVYMASELGVSGQIQSIAVYVANTPVNYVMQSQKIYMRNTTATAPSSSYPLNTTYSLVYDGPITYSGTGWKQIQLTTPFSYDVSKNLEVLFENHNGAAQVNAPAFRYTQSTTSSVRTNFGRDFLPVPCVIGCGPVTNILNVDISILPCTITSTGAVTGPVDVGCGGTSKRLVLSGQDAGLALQWQSAVGGASFANIPGATDAVYNTPAAAAPVSTDYRVQVSRNIPGCTALTNTLRGVGSTPAGPDGAVTITSDNTYCTDDIITLRVTGSTGTVAGWQLSLDGVNYTDIPNSNRNPFTYRANTTATYRAVIANSKICGRYSNTAKHSTSTNYYVNDPYADNDVWSTSTGDAINDGLSPATPKATIQQIIDTYAVGPCDTIFVDSGKYFEGSTFTNADQGGTNGMVVVYGAGSDKAFIQPAGSLPDNFFLNEASYIKVERLSLYDFNQSVEGRVSRYNFYILNGRNNILDNCAIINRNVPSIYITSANSKASPQNTISNNEISNTAFEGIGIAVMGDANNTTIRNNHVVVSGGGSGSSSGIYVETNYDPSNLQAETGINITRNTVEVRLGGGIFLNGYGRFIDNSSITYNDITILSPKGALVLGIYLGNVGNNSAYRNVISNNRIKGGKVGIYAGALCNFLQILNNYISTSSIGLYNATERDPGFRSNIDLNPSQTGEVTTAAAPSGSRIDRAQTAVITQNPSLAQTSAQNTLYFNSFFNYYNSVVFDNTHTNIWNVRNNIFSVPSDNSYASCINMNTAQNMSACDYNLYQTYGTNVGQRGSAYFSALTDWQSNPHTTAGNGDVHSLSGDPLYVQSYNNNLDLRYGSPAVGKAITIAGITRDINDDLRGNPPVIGAKEKTTVRVEAGDDRTICIGGNVQLNATGGNGTYNWSPSAGLSNPNISNPIATPAQTTTYTVSSMGGSDQVVVYVTEVAVSAGPDKTICEGDAVTLEGSVNAETYAWSPADGLSCTNCLNPIASPGSTTVYTLTAISANGCNGSASVTVHIYPHPVITVDKGIPTICEGQSVQLSATGNGSIVWRPREGLDNSDSNQPTATPPETIRYVAYLTDEHGCRAEDEVYVNVNHYPVYNPQSVNIDLCQGQSVELDGSASSSFFLWDPNDAIDSNGGSPYDFATPKQNVTYTVTAINGNCSATKHFYINIIKPPDAVFTYSYPGLTITFTLAKQQSGDSYLWSFGDGSPSGEEQTPVHTYTNPGVYEVCATVSNSCAHEVHCENVLVRDIVAPCCTNNNNNNIPR